MPGTPIGRGTTNASLPGIARPKNLLVDCTLVHCTATSRLSFMRDPIF